MSASGAVNPVTQVSVGTQVSGQIRDLYVDFNAEVKAGQLLAQIDRRRLNTGNTTTIAVMLYG